MFIFSPRKIEIARSARGSKLKGPHAKDATTELYFRAENFGDLITADHKVLSDNCESRNNLRNVIHTCNSLEFGKVCEDLSCNYRTSTHHRSKTHGIDERVVRRVKEGISVVLLQSGLNESWWADSMECYTYLRNVTDLLSDGKTPCERRLGQPFKGPIISFGSLVEYHPIKIAKSVPNPSIWEESFTWIVPRIRIVRRVWKGDVLIADLEELETMDASDIYSIRLNAKEVIFPKEKGELIFPIADGRIKNPWRRFGFENIHFDTASNNSRRK